MRRERPAAAPTRSSTATHLQGAAKVAGNHVGHVNRNPLSGPRQRLQDSQGCLQGVLLDHLFKKTMRVPPRYPQLRGSGSTAGPSEAPPADEGGKPRRAHRPEGPATCHPSPPTQASSTLTEEGCPGEDSSLVTPPRAP
ncbi:hypothetical protein E2C01_079005 [Portunus trituberculatus]|uniref:Uncharacterized protein n=1 Tax=Portunus trituberculatus TaxID=210409 RepID=A0A5B7IPG8_PORTR|nr:hypothetical protein [Portunus trituberculatus]